MAMNLRFSKIYELKTIAFVKNIIDTDIVYFWESIIEIFGNRFKKSFFLHTYEVDFTKYVETKNKGN